MSAIIASSRPAGTVVEAVEIPPYSLVIGNPMVTKAGYYQEKLLGDPS